MTRLPETHLGDWSAGYDSRRPDYGIARCGALDVRVTTEHAIRRGGVSCPVCLQLAGRVSLTVAELHEAADSGNALIPYLDGVREVRSVTRRPSGGFRLLTGRDGAAIRSGGETRVWLTPESRRAVLAKLADVRRDSAAVASAAAEDQRQQLIRERERRQT